MAKNHGAKQQKKAAKHKAKRAFKRSSLMRRTSSDPTVRLQAASKLRVAQAFVGGNLWQDGIGYLVIARQETDLGLIYGVFLVDVYCLGVKNAFWQAGSAADFKELLGKMETTQTMVPIAPACLVKIVKGAVEFARSFGLLPHADYRHASQLLEGIDPATCPHEFTFGRDGKPFYMQGPHESAVEAAAIIARVTEAGGHFVALAGIAGSHGFRSIDGEFDDLEMLEGPDLADDEE